MVLFSHQLFSCRYWIIFFQTIMVPSKNEIIKLLYELFFPDDPQVSVMLHVTFHNWFSIWALTQPDFSENDFSSKFYVPEPLYLLKAMIFFLQKNKLLFPSSVYIVPPRRSYGLRVDYPRRYVVLSASRAIEVINRCVIHCRSRWSDNGQHNGLWRGNRVPNCWRSWFTLTKTSFQHALTI